MAECAISGQTVVTGHYCLFNPGPDGQKRFYALSSPPATEAYAGTVQTLACTVEQVAADIAAGGVGGTLVWSPKNIVGNAGQFLTPLEPVRIPVTLEGKPDGVELAEYVRSQIARGGVTRIRRQVPIEGEGVLTVDVKQDIWPPFRGLGF